MDKPGLLQFLTQGPMGWAVAAIWGAIWGSFFNVLIVRVPAGQSVTRPASHCRSCQTPLRWYDNIPIFSFLLLRGRCRHCGSGFSARYALVELLVCLLSTALFVVHLRHPSVPVGLAVARFVILSLFAGLLVGIAMIDIDTMKIPNVITYPAIPLAVALSLFMGHPLWWEGAAGAVAGYLVIRLFADGYRLLTGREGMGYGDAKLLALIGALLGWRALLPVLFLASFQGSLIGIAVLSLTRRSRGPEQQPADDQTAEQTPLRHARVPFGPFLSLAALEIMLLGERLAPFFPFFDG